MLSNRIEWPMKNSNRQCGKDIIPASNGTHGDGRNARGQFVKGNVGGPGNPHSKRTNQIRQSLLAAVTPADIQAIIRKLIELARAGDVVAAREVMQRAIGNAAEGEMNERLDILEDAIGFLLGQIQSQGMPPAR